MQYNNNNIETERTKWMMEIGEREGKFVAVFRFMYIDNERDKKKK